MHTQKYYKYTSPCILYTQKTFKVCRKCPTRHYGTKNIQRFHGIYFFVVVVLAIQPLYTVPISKSGVFILRLSWKKKWFFIWSAHQLEIAFYVGVVTVSTSLWSSKIPFGENILKFYAYCQSFSEFIYTQNLLCLEGLIPWCLHSLLVFKLF